MATEEPEQAEQAEPTWRTTEPDGKTQQLHKERAEQAIADARVTADEGPADLPDGWNSGLRPREATFDPSAAPVTAPPSHQAEEIPSANPITDTGSSFLPPVAVDGAETCIVCGGRVPTDHELLVQVRELIAPIGPTAMHLFYERLFFYAPELRNLFPTRIEVQEEKLLSAIVALLSLFQAGEAEMGQLDAALSKFGRSHVRFDPAATIEEYATVWRALSEVLNENLGGQLTARHLNVIRRAYEYAAGSMLRAQATARLKGAGRRRRTS